MCFVLTAFQIHTDTLGVYCNVNRQYMKLDRVSVLVKMKVYAEG